MLDQQVGVLGMRAFVSILVISILSGPVSAADGPGSVREACRADVATLCAGIQPGGGRIRACLKENRDRLSQGCKSAIAAMIQARQAARNSSQAPQPGQPSAPPVMGPVVP